MRTHANARPAASVPAERSTGEPRRAEPKAGGSADAVASHARQRATAPMTRGPVAERADGRARMAPSVGRDPRAPVVPQAPGRR